MGDDGCRPDKRFAQQRLDCRVDSCLKSCIRFPFGRASQGKFLLPSARFLRKASFNLLPAKTLPQPEVKLPQIFAKFNFNADAPGKDGCRLEARSRSLE